MTAKWEPPRKILRRLIVQAVINAIVNGQLELPEEQRRLWLSAK